MARTSGRKGAKEMGQRQATQERRWVHKGRESHNGALGWLTFNKALASGRFSASTSSALAR